MVKDGIGGGNTTTGLLFEDKVDLINAFKNNGLNHEDFGIIKQKHAFVSWLGENGVDWKDRVSAKLLPDNVLITDDTVYVVEVKWQQVAGSVDEKLQTCAFKKRQYVKLTEGLNKKVEYIYLLCDWFKDKRYTDVLDYIEDVGCHYFFNSIPLNFFEGK